MEMVFLYFRKEFLSLDLEEVLIPDDRLFFSSRFVDIPKITNDEYTDWFVFYTNKEILNRTEREVQNILRAYTSSDKLEHTSVLYKVELPKDILEMSKGQTSWYITDFRQVLEKKEILYLCDRLACSEKYNGPCPEHHECRHTPDITHAKNFKQGELDSFWEEGYVLMGIDLATTPDYSSTVLNKHGEYVIKFAENHGISIAEAHEHPMVKAHLHCINTIEDPRYNPEDVFKPAT